MATEYFLRGIALSVAFFGITVGTAACEFDRYDENRKDIEDRLAADDTEDSTGDPADPSSADDDDTSVGDDFSCDYALCTSDEDCTCVPNAQCIRKGPDIVKNHCFIVDCDPGDPASCPEGKNCIDASSLSQGALGMVCFSL